MVIWGGLGLKVSLIPLSGAVLYNYILVSFVVVVQVLYTFLEYFSNFDWDKYCVSLWGPVPLSSLPGVAAGKQHISCQYDSV